MKFFPSWKSFGKESKLKRAVGIFPDSSFSLFDYYLIDEQVGRLSFMLMP